MNVLITGAAGRVGQGVTRVLARHYGLRLMDLDPAESLMHHDWVVGSVLQPPLLETALENVEAVVHCAIHMPAEDTPGETRRTFEVNLTGLHMLLAACERQEVRRFVHVSSTATVIGHWYAGREIAVDSPPTTRGRYSLTKWLQEKICDHAARNADMTIVALRPWMPRDGLTTIDETGQQVARPYAPGLIDLEDFGEACRLAIETEHLSGFHVFHTVATPEARARFDAERTERLLGFRARQDFQSLRDAS